MAKFKIGDKVRILSYPHTSRNHLIGDIGTVKSLHGGQPSWPIEVAIVGKRNGDYAGKEIELVKSEEKTTMARRTFRQRKDSPELKKGTLVQEACDDGNQEYRVLDITKYYRFDDWSKYFNNPVYKLSRNAVEQNSDWFEEVFPATKDWLTKEELDTYREFVASPRKRIVLKSVPATSPTMGARSSYGYLYSMAVGDTKIVSAQSIKNVRSAAHYAAERTGRSFRTETISDTRVRITRVS